MIMGNRVEFIELVLGALISGVWLTPINWHLTAEEAAYIVRDSESRLVIADPEFEAVARAAAGDLPVLVAGGELDAALAAASDEPFDGEGEAGGAMLYTSGTTGQPKGVKRATSSTVATQVRLTRATGPIIGLDGSGPHLVTGPLYHAAPLGYAFIDLQIGAPLVIMPRWDERQALRLIDERRVHNSHLVPTMFVRLLRLPDEDRAGFDGSSLRTVLHGAAPVSVPVKTRMIEWWGPVLLEYWGASEGGVVTIVGSQDWLAHPGTVGRAVPSYEVFAADPEGNRLPAGEIGTLWCRNTLTDQVFEYHNAPGEDGGRLPRAGDVHHRRHRAGGRGRLGVPGRPRRQHDHLGRRQHLPGRDRAGAGGTPGGARCRRVRDPGRGVGRVGQGRRRAGRRLPGRHRSWRPRSWPSPASTWPATRCPARSTSRRPCPAIPPASSTRACCGTSTGRAPTAPSDPPLQLRR